MEKETRQEANKRTFFRGSRRILLRLAVIVAFAAGVGITWNFTFGAGLPLVLERSKSAVHSPSLRESQSVSLEELRSLIEEGDVFVLDARPDTEYHHGHIPSALSVPVDDAEEMAGFIASQVPPDALTVVYCESSDCYGAARLFDFLRELGYSNVRLFPGGLPAWEEAGLSLEKAEE